MKNICKLLLISALCCSVSLAERIGDLTDIKGVRENKLQGFGIVVGLPNTGDRGNFATANVTTLIQKYGIKVPADVDLKSKNIAVVAVNAKLPPFAKKGQKVVVTVSSLGDSKTLRGGTLTNTPLMGLDGNTYAIASGQILVDGMSATGLDGSTLDINTASVGRIPSGASIERELDTSHLFRGGSYTLNLNKSSFELAHNIESAINDKYGKGAAQALDPSSVEVFAPRNRSSRVSYIAMINKIPVEIPEAPAQIVINSRSGTVTFTRNVTLQPAAISEGNIMVNISEEQGVSQPNPLGEGRTVVTSNSQVSIERAQGEIVKVEGAGTLHDLIEALNALGTGPKDMASIIQLLKESGAISAEVITI